MLSVFANSGSSENLESLANADNSAFGRRSQDGNRTSLSGLGSRGSSMDGLPSAAGYSTLFRESLCGFQMGLQQIEYHICGMLCNWTC